MMDKETAEKFTRRIGEANKSEMIVVVYDIAGYYVNKALECMEQGDGELSKNIDGAIACISDLMQALNFDYDVSKVLLNFYTKINQHILTAYLKQDKGQLKEVLKMLSEMRDAFAKIAESDTSAPMIDSTRHIKAGMTYGRGNLVESVVNVENSREFSV